MSTYRSPFVVRAVVDELPGFGTGYFQVDQPGPPGKDLAWWQTIRLTGSGVDGSQMKFRRYVYQDKVLSSRLSTYNFSAAPGGMHHYLWLDSGHGFIFSYSNSPAVLHVRPVRVTTDEITIVPGVGTALLAIPNTSEWTNFGVRLVGTAWVEGVPMLVAQRGGHDADGNILADLLLARLDAAFGGTCTIADLTWIRSGPLEWNADDRPYQAYWAGGSSRLGQATGLGYYITEDGRLHQFNASGEVSAVPDVYFLNEAVERVDPSDGQPGRPQQLHDGSYLASVQDKAGGDWRWIRLAEDGVVDAKMPASITPLQQGAQRIGTSDPIWWVIWGTKIRSDHSELLFNHFYNPGVKLPVWSVVKYRDGHFSVTGSGSPPRGDGGFHTQPDWVQWMGDPWDLAQTASRNEPTFGDIGSMGSAYWLVKSESGLLTRTWLVQFNPNGIAVPEPPTVEFRHPR